ncbi:MAG: nucleotidyltransferase family protein [Clostridia bacterium]|nr:nucleotidyltransferase family protein [Clostridia bacterium]
MSAKSLMMTLLVSAVDASQMPEVRSATSDSGVVGEALELAEAQDLAQVVAYSLKKSGALPKDNTGDKLNRSLMLAAYRHEGQAYEIERVSAAFEECGIDFALLKGAVIKNYYPEPFLRTMSDVDILVKEQQLERAEAVLCDKLGYTVRERGPHDVSLFSAGGVHIELHFCLMDEQSIGILGDDAAKLISDAWQTARLLSGSAHSYSLSKEVFYAFHLLHMAKHILNGGCGVKPFLDTYILSKRGVPKLSGERLVAFERGVMKLCSVWFGGAEGDEFTASLENYVLSGGVYGNEEQRVVVGQSAKGGRAAYLCSRIFLPYSELKFRYPVLKKHKWLTPIFQIVRWIEIPFKKGITGTRQQLEASFAASQSDRDRLGDLLTQLGLK